MKKSIAVICIAIVALSFAFAQGGAEETYPNGNINIIVSSKAGGDTDAYARVIAEYLDDELGVPVNIINKNSAIEGTREVYNAEPDGYTVEFFHASSLLTKICGKTDIDGLDQTVCCVPVVDSTNTLVIPGKKFKNIDDFVQRARSGEEIIASVNQGSYAHLACLLFEKAIGANFKYVDSQNASERIADMLAGRIDIFFSPYGTVSQYVQTGDFIALGVMSEERNAFFPELPTFVEQGYDVVMDKIFYFAFPPKTNEAIVNTFASAVERVLARPEAKENFAVYFVEPKYNSPEESLRILEEAKESYSQFESILRGESK